MIREKRVTTEMMIYSDLVIQSGNSFLEELGIEDLHIYKTKPKCCPSCKKTHIIGLEILGTREGTIMWICDDCDALFLKYDIERTEEWISRGKNFWTTPQDWLIPQRGELN
jgi:transposase-like protein|tara:strand:+ start:2442 stop:2774 length:333 start_codon:yes stop_codon:yes gene_type:complete